MRLLTTTLRQFQSTLPHGERLLPPRYQQALCLRFNPRSHMGSDFAEIVAMAARLVSIHAPTWGATYLLYLCTKFNSVSIHAPTWGATLKAGSEQWLDEFQSTLPHGERQTKYM